MNLPEKIKEASMFVLVGKIITGIFSILVPLIIIRNLTVDNYGMYNVFLSKYLLYGNTV